MNRLDFEGRHAVVTGGATGLGFGIAQRLVASGGSVTLWDRDEAAAGRAAEALGAKAFALKVDVTQQPSVAKAVAATLAHAPRIDALVNSAGITGPNVKLWDYPVDDWRQVMEVNVNGVFLCCREVVAQMRKQGAKGEGRIVNIASVAGKDGNPNASAYSASKAAVIGLTKSLGKELADTGIRVNCVTPAAVKTAIFDQMSPDHIAFMLSKIPMGRFGTVEEVAAMVGWLCTDDCSFSTGAVFDLSGGRSTY
ncbi:3-oxoacyl-[acyl-carrier protein] reductase [Variovorax boronicumulans]|uniref:3-oxoacyl-[acyl-carrier protein] reductase n=1 Tax=Variovorax boronicumulans TaxID=436515 RepID=A0AAW8DRL5_9BURK|nr:SDR family NAD(P)-dependent oxidoreductase [Variovorax boronicumulans]MDP9877037.1 3-oxoacyl-[acyl-carrier protein] reductase [Variovorax boronicumulans]MDP9922086.1 3-oxoacyl-[acyl-carrier protein] reductase [Variovorax boronicumulans]